MPTPLMDHTVVAIRLPLKQDHWDVKDVLIRQMPDPALHLCLGGVRSFRFKCLLNIDCCHHFVHLHLYYFHHLHLCFDTQVLLPLHFNRSQHLPPPPPPPPPLPHWHHVMHTWFPFLGERRLLQASHFFQLSYQ